MAGRHSRVEPAHPVGGHGPGHTHGAPATPLHVEVLPRLLLVGFLVVCGLATVVGAVLLFPRGDTVTPHAQYAAPGVTFPSATVQRVLPRCTDQGSGQCAELVVRLDSGPDKHSTSRVRVSPQDAESGLTAGDHVELVRVPGGAGVPATYNLFGVERHVPIALMTALFIVVLVVVARWRGLLAVVGLVVSGVVVLEFMLPALIEGRPGAAVALVGSSGILFVVLYLAHGVSLRTSTALAGTVVGVLVTAALGWYAIGSARLSGVGDDIAGTLGAEVHLDFQGLLMAALILASLGILNDITITQASAVWELRAAAPDLSRRQLFASGLRIGRDHIASAVYTIVFAYAGTALALLLLVELYQRPLFSLLNSENIAEEVMRTLAAAVGLVLAVPLTTLMAVAVVGHAAVGADDTGPEAGHDLRTG